jgi:hypothetical protein
MDGFSRIVPLAGLRAAAANFHWPGVGRQGVRLYYSIQIPIQLLPVNSAICSHALTNRPAGWRHAC